MVKQHGQQDRTIRTARHQVHLWLPLHTKFQETDVKQVQMSEMKALKWPTTEWQDNTKDEIKNF